MKKYILTTLSLIPILILSGCASAIPNAINGKYYMAGDSNCKRYRVISDDRIMCIDSDGRDTGYRNAMNNQELQMYQFNQSREDAAWQQVNYNNQQQANRNLYQTQQLMNRMRY